MADTSLISLISETGGFRYGQPTRFKFTSDGRTALFLRGGPRTPISALYELDLASGTERELTTAAKLLDGAAESMTAEERARQDRTRSRTRGISSYQLLDGGERLFIPLSGRFFILNRRSQWVQELKSGAGWPIDPRLSPTGESVAAVRQGDLYVTDLKTGLETQLTKKTSKTETWGTAEFVAQEEMGRHQGYWWSPDGQRLAVQHTEEEAVEQLWIAAPHAPEKRPRTQRYPRAGTPNAQVSLSIFSLSAEAEPISVRWDRAAYPYLATVRWQEKAPLTLVVQNRAQTESLVLTVDAATGETRLLHRERDDTWINLDQSAGPV